MAKATATAPNSLIQAVIVKKCDRAGHRPDSNKGCANGTCQHTCEPAQVETCAHKWTVRYSANSRQREKSFAAFTDAETFQLNLSADKKAQGSLFVDPAAGNRPFAPECVKFVNGLAKAKAASKATYKGNFGNRAVTKLLEGVSVIQAARMHDDFNTLLNATLAHYHDDYRGNIKRIITGTLDEMVRQGVIPRHTVSIELGARVITAEQYEKENRPLVRLTDDEVRALAEGITRAGTDKLGRAYTRTSPGLGIAPWLQRTMGLRIREALGVRKADFMTRDDGTRYLHLCWQATENGKALEPLKHRQAGQFRDVPVPDMVWDMVQALPDGPLCPGLRAPYMPYSTAQHRFDEIMNHLGIEGAHTHSLRHQFATEALEADPRELANISRVLGHDSIETTLRFYIHASKDAEQRIGAFMNARWATPKASGKPRTAGKAKAAPKAKGPRLLRAA
jgi:integrase